MRESIIKKGIVEQITQYELVKQRFFRKQCQKLEQKLTQCHQLQTILKNLLTTVNKYKSGKQVNFSQKLMNIQEHMSKMFQTLKEENHFFSDQIYNHKQEEKNQYKTNKQFMRSYEQMKAQIRITLTQVQNRIRSVQQLPIQNIEQNILTIQVTKIAAKNKMEQKIALYTRIFQKLKQNNHLFNKLKESQQQNKPFFKKILTNKLQKKQSLKQKYEKSICINRKQQSLGNAFEKQKFKITQSRKKIQRKCEILQQAKNNLQKDLQMIKLKQKIFGVGRVIKQECITYLKYLQQTLAERFNSNLYYSLKRRSKSFEYRTNIYEFDSESEVNIQASQLMSSQNNTQKRYEVTESFLAHLKYLNASKSVIVSEKFITDSSCVDKTQSEQFSSHLSRKQKTFQDSFEHQQIIAKKFCKFQNQKQSQ